MHLKSIFEGFSTSSNPLPELTLAKLTGRVFDAVGRQKVGQALRDLITQGLKQLPEGRRLGIIEISEGSLLFIQMHPAMDLNCGDYIFASTSSDTLETAAQLKERFPVIDTRLIGTDTNHHR